MTEDSKHLLIVGGGQAAARTALAARRNGFPGSICILGAEPLPPYERPPLSKGYLSGSDPTPDFCISPAAAKEMRIDMRSSTRVVSIDTANRRVEDENGGIYPYDELAIATGAAPRKISIDGYPQVDILELRTAQDSDEIRRRAQYARHVAIIGGGFIGLETAATLNALGLSVTVVEFSDHLLPRLGSKEVADAVLRFHRDNGICIELSAMAQSGDGKSIVLADGRRIDADFVVAGIGVNPDTHLALQAGLSVDDGILTDEIGRTSVEGIWAVGDVARQFNPTYDRHIRLESWDGANTQAEVCGMAIAGAAEDLEKPPIPWVWSDQGTLQLQIAGVPDRAHEFILRGDPQGDDGFSVVQFANNCPIAAITFARTKDMPLLRRLLEASPRLESPKQLSDESEPLRRIVKQITRRAESPKERV